MSPKGADKENENPSAGARDIAGAGANTPPIRPDTGPRPAFGPAEASRPNARNRNTAQTKRAILNRVTENRGDPRASRPLPGAEGPRPTETCYNGSVAS